MNIAVALNPYPEAPTTCELYNASIWASFVRSLYLALPLTSTKWPSPLPNITFSSFNTLPKNGCPNDVSGELNTCLYANSGLVDIPVWGSSTLQASTLTALLKVITSFPLSVTLKGGCEGGPAKQFKR